MTKVFKYRDQVVLITRTLQELDGKLIKQNERQYLSTLSQRKQAVNITKKQVADVKGKGPELGVDGHQKKVYGGKKHEQQL